MWTERCKQANTKQRIMISCKKSTAARKLHSRLSHPEAERQYTKLYVPFFLLSSSVFPWLTVQHTKDRSFAVPFEFTNPNTNQTKRCFILQATTHEAYSQFLHSYRPPACLVNHRALYHMKSESLQELQQQILY